MPNISIDLESAAGARQGSGPLTSASNLKTVQRLSKAGTVSFDMPCSDPKAADVIAKRVVRPHTLRNGAVVALPAGIVDSIAVRGRGADPPLLTIAGDDILSELVNRRVLGLGIDNGSGGPVAIATALASIMALAPSGWTIDTSTYTASGATVYKKFGNETVLAALIWVANAVGEQFRLGTGKQIVWLYHDQPVSGLRATQTGDPVALAGNTAVLLIDALEEVADTHTVITRLYPYGAGNEAARVTLAHATYTPPAGYTLDAVNNFIKYDSADATNRIEDVVTINTIAEIGTTATDQISASNQLAVAAYEELRRRIVAVKTYKLTVTKLDAEIKVGETINVSYRKTIDGYVAVNIDANLVVLEVSLSYGASGVPSAALTVATVDRYPVTGAAGVVQSMAGNQQAQSGTVQKAAQLQGLTTAPASAGQTLAYNAVTGQFEPADVDDIGAAPAGATFITQTAHAGLSAEQALAALASGYMKVTTATGVVSSQATPIPAADGGTGAGALTAGSVPFIGASGVYSEDNAHLQWDDTNDRLGIGKAATLSPLDVFLQSGAASLSAALRVLSLGRNASGGTPANGFGGILTFLLDTNGATDRSAARFVWSLVDATDASRKNQISLRVFDTAERTIFTADASGTAPRIGFLGAAAAARAAAYTQTYSTAARTMPAYTTDAESGAYTGIATGVGGTPYAQLTDLNSLRVAYENLRANHDAIIQVINSLIDDFQANGLVG
jgi:hypothetical protein